MNNFEYPTDKVVAFRLATVFRSDVDSMRRFFNEEPDVFRKLRERNQWIVCEAARRSSPEAVRVLIELGTNINERDSNGFTGLSSAVRRDRYDVAKVLLECGADPNLDCPIFGVTCEGLEYPIAMAKLLLDHGANINQPFLVEGRPPRNVLSEAIERGRTELVDFLKSRGAKLPDGWLAAEEAEAPITEAAPGDYSADIMAYFRRHYGKPEKRVIQEIVPTSDYPVVVHHIPPCANKEDLAVLFTEGLSRFDMPVPTGAEKYRRGELMVALDKTWPRPEKAIKDPQWAWPIQWLRKIAAYPVENNTWLGAQLSTMTEEEPPKPLGPGTKFTSWLLVSLEAEESVVRCKDGTPIQIYQLFPLYTEEYLYARKHGAEALMSLFVERDIQEHIDLNRPNVAVPSPE